MGLFSAGTMGILLKTIIPITVDEVAKRVVEGVERKKREEEVGTFLSKEEFVELVKEELKPIIPDRKVFLIRRISLGILLFLVFISEVLFPVLRGFGLELKNPEFSPELVGLLLTLSFSPNPRAVSTALTGLFAKSYFKKGKGKK